MTVVLWISGLLLLAGGLMAVLRAERGPSMLDRAIALDITMATLVGATALYAAVERRADVVPVLVALSLVGFVGSVTMARFVAAEPPGEGRVMTPEEDAAHQATDGPDDHDDTDETDDHDDADAPGGAGVPDGTDARDGAAGPRRVDDREGGPS
jgi:multicomponent Na+:H+ antiporter subunit F